MRKIRLSKKQTVYVGRVCPTAAGCKTNFQICIEVTVATTHPTRNLVEFQHTPAGHTLSFFCFNFRVTVMRVH
jgi:hypothetical protein